MQRYYAHAWLGVRRIGPCTVPVTGPVILALNHTSGVDPMAVYATCTHRLVSFVVAEEYYSLPIAGWFQRLVGCIPIDRRNPNKSFLANSLRLLKGGGCLAIFPEGTFHPPNVPPPDAKPGVGLLALRTEAVVIPGHISGARFTHSPVRAYFLPHRLRVRYGGPVDLNDLRRQARDRDAPQLAADRIMAAIRALGNEGECGGR